MQCLWYNKIMLKNKNEKAKIIDENMMTKSFDEKKIKQIELLAPVGNMQSLMAAINGGADAVYLGLSNFNARNNIENFTIENLKEGVDKAHLFGVKVYLALNILFKDDEVKDVLDMVRFAIKCKVDAFIVQDIGISNLLSKNFKGIELHASTQMGLHNLEGAKFAEKLGFKRIVLSRETPLSEIKRIKEGTNLEIEYFVQGALCVGFSGNCYLCSLLAGASGNRGKCKQFCRLKYKINGSAEGYYLSTKDFCMLPSLKEMIESGVMSLKIEGRARRPAYVAAAVQTYRKAIDNNFNFENQDVENLKKVFNRGDFISGYFKGEKIIYSNAQNHIGIEIGKIVSFKSGKRFNEIVVYSSHKLLKGDTIKLFENEREIATISPVDIKTIGENKYLFTTTSIAKKGQSLRLIVDGKFEETLLKKQRKLEFDVEFQAKDNLVLMVKLLAKNLEIEETFKNLLSPAKSQPLSENDVLQSFNKCGDEFKLHSLKCELDNVFLRKSDLNEIRRVMLEKLRKKLIQANEKKEEVIEKNNLTISTQNAPKNQKKIVFFNDLNKIKHISEEKLENFEYFVYSPSLYSIENVKAVYQYFYNKKLYLDMPIIATCEDITILKSILNDLPDLGIYATNYYALTLRKPDKTIIGSEMNVVNSYAIDFFTQNGYENIVISKEDFNFQDILAVKTQLFIDKRKPNLIYFKHCPIKEHFGGSCADCKYRDNIKYTLGNESFKLQRKKVVNCHFYLKREKVNPRKGDFGEVIEI